MSYNTNYIFCTRSDHIWKSGLLVLVELGPTKKRYVAEVTENEIINAIALFRVECSNNARTFGNIPSLLPSS